MIRPFEMKDLKQVMDIWLHCSIEAHPFIDASYFLNHYQMFQEDHLLKSQSQVYEIDGKVVAFISIKQDMVISSINVAKGYRLSGIGEALMSKLINKFHQISIKCYLKNTDALAFLTKIGFEIVAKEMDMINNEEIIILQIDQKRTKS